MAADIQRFPTNLATASSPGAMSASDKAKVDNVPADTTTALAGKYNSRTVYDAAVNGASVAISNLNSAKRYHIFGVADQNGATEYLKVQPNGSDAGCFSWHNGALGFVDPQGQLALLYKDAVSAVSAFSATIEPRRTGGGAGASSYRANSFNAETTKRYSAITSGITTTDFTSLTIVFSATSRTGWLTVIEESP